MEERVREKEGEEEKRMRGKRVRLDLSEGDVMCDNTNQHSLTRPFDLHLVYMYLHDLHILCTLYYVCSVSYSFCIVSILLFYCSIVLVLLFSAFLSSVYYVLCDIEGDILRQSTRK